MLAVFYASEVQADEAVDARIEKAEQMLLGKTSSDQPVESRLDAVEMNLYGKTKHGSVVKRVDAISDFLGLKDGAAKSANGGETKNEQKTPITDAATNSGTSAESVQRDSAKAEAVQTNATTADLAKTEAAKTEAAKTEAVKTDAVKTEAVKTNAATSDAAKANQAASKVSATSNKVSTTSKIGLIPLKPQEAKMAMPPTAPKKIESMPPSAPSIAATMSATGFNSQARELLREGLRQYSSGQYRDAEDTFRRVLTVDPRNADAFYNLGSLAEHNHDYVMALTNYRAALNFNPKDKDYIAAVTAMEHQLSASTRSVSASPSAKRTATLGHFQVPVDAATSSAPLTASTPIGASTGQPFQLSGTQNDVLMNTTQFTNNNYMPTMNVNQNPPPPTMGVAQQAPKKGGGLGKVMNVGMRAALYSSGLHCPICRMMGGGFHF